MSLASKPGLSVEPSATGHDAPADGFSRELMAAYENWSYSSLPTSVVERIKLFVLDTLGVIAAAAEAPGIPEVNRLLLGWEGAGPSTMLIGKGRVSPPTAALANGAAAHALDFDDNHDPGRVHAYAVILPAALAAAEARGGVSGRELIAALATGVELQARLGLAAPNSMSRGWHPTTVMGALGAAAAAARVLGLRGGVYEIQANASDIFLGGDDFDRRILDWLIFNFNSRVTAFTTSCCVISRPKPRRLPSISLR